MRALVVTTWIFINLVFFGMCGYMYLLWSQYWLYLESQTTTGTSQYDKQINEYNRGNQAEEVYINETSLSAFHLFGRRKRTKHAIKDNPVTLVKNAIPRFPNLQYTELLLDSPSNRCSKNESTNECDIKTTNYKQQILIELNKVFMDESSVLRDKSKNTYNVRYANRGNYMNRKHKDIICELKKITIKTIQRSDLQTDVNNLKDFIPKKKLLENKYFDSCAIVASSGSLIESQLGKVIDSHGIVLRFNHAPTEGFEHDVGSKTTFRILNSQVVTKPEFKFLQSQLYQNITLVLWDPSQFNATLDEWFQGPEFNLFPNYLEHRKKYRKTKTYLLNPRSLWDLWIFLQDNFPNQLKRNPPSSGFLGLTVLLPHCDFVDMFEYIPSSRVTSRCHYYDAENNPSCTFGSWHPLAAEKLLTYSLNIASDKDVFQTGYVRIPGFKKFNC